MGKSKDNTGISISYVIPEQKAKPREAIREVDNSVRKPCIFRNDHRLNLSGPQIFIAIVSKLRIHR